jgi:predicted transposase YdaD
MKTAIYRYRVIRLWEQDSTPLLANPALLPLATLAQADSPNALLEQVASQLDMIEEHEQRRNISACTGILASLRFDNDTIRQVLREEIMREAPMYQEILQEGKREEALSFTMRLLTRRIGTVTLDLQFQIQNLTTSQLEELGVALLDFNNPSDLAAWLQNQ